MNEPNAINQIILSLEDAGKSQETIERVRQLERRRITPSTVIPKRDFLFRMFGKPCFPKGELVALTGKEKSGKTFVTSLLMTLCLRRELLGMTRNAEDRQSVLWYDTEQSEESTLEILVERISRMCGLQSATGSANTIATDAPGIAPGCEAWPAELFNVFNVRAEPWRERLPLLEEAIMTYRPDLVVLDGIRDLVDDINDGVLAQEVIERLMHLSSESGCCMVCVLHQNKSLEDKSLRGWIGTELANKSFEVYECSKNADRIFSCRQTRTRKYDITDTLRFTVDDEGIPQPCSLQDLDSISRGSATNGKKPAQGTGCRPNNTFNPDYVDPNMDNRLVVNYRKLFADIVPQGQTMTDDVVFARATALANVKTPSLYNRLKAAALQEHVICHTTDASGKELIAREAGLLQGELPF